MKRVHRASSVAFSSGPALSAGSFCKAKMKVVCWAEPPRGAWRPPARSPGRGPCVQGAWKARLFSRRGHDWSDRFPRIREALASLRAQFRLRSARHGLPISSFPAPGGIKLSEHIEADGETVFRHACRLGCEGIVSKRRASPYRSGRTRTWIKVKNPDSPAIARVWER